MRISLRRWRCQPLRTISTSPTSITTTILFLSWILSFTNGFTLFPHQRGNLVPTSTTFSPKTTSFQSIIITPPTTTTTHNPRNSRKTELFFWRDLLTGKHKKKSPTETTEPEFDDDECEEVKRQEEKTTTTTKKDGPSMPFYASMTQEPSSDDETKKPVTSKSSETTSSISEGKEPEGPTTTTTTTTNLPTNSTDQSNKDIPPLNPTTTSSSPPSPPPPPPQNDKDDAVAQAQSLKRQAEKTRLEAEKMEVMLTLEKISNLETKLERKTILDDPDQARELQNQIAILKQKLDKTSSDSQDRVTRDTVEVVRSRTSPVVGSGGDGGDDATASPSTTTMETNQDKDEDDDGIPKLTPEELQKRTNAFLATPQFLRTLTAKAAGFEDDTNATAVVLKLYQDEQGYQMARRRIENVERQSGQRMTAEKLQEEVERFEKMPKYMRDMTAKFLGFEDSRNSTAILLTMWENEMGESSTSTSQQKPSLVKTTEDGGKKADETATEGGFGWFGPDKSDTERLMESLFPKSTRKDEEMPTEAQINRFVSDVIDKDAFVTIGKPESVPGGYILRGNNRKESVSDMMETIDAALQKSNLAGRLSFFYVYDPTPITEDQIMTGDRPPVLLVMGPDVSRPTNFLRSIVTAFGIASISFLSTYPFALDDDLAARIDEQLALSSNADLSFLTELTSPIFFSFLAIQLAHELAHWAVAKYYKFDVAIPTFVPSPILGITSSITSLKSPPKDKQALLDFALAGPFTGIVLSILTLYIGLQLTLSMDTESYNRLPSLPMAFLYQSSLGGGIVEATLGRGTLDVSDPLTTPIHLHPFTIAGYASLLVNGLNLLPFGRTDGGRISMALFGRSGAQLVSLICATTLLIAGLFLSDALLLYFSFILFFQSELEIPIKNEVDDVDFSRVLMATGTAVLVLLTVIPIA